MLLIKVEQLVPGMTFDKPLLSIDNDSPLTPPNAPLTGSEIDTLKKWGISEVKTEGNITSGHSLKEDKPKSVLGALDSELQDTDEQTITISKTEKIKILTLYDSWVTKTGKIVKDLSSGVKVTRNQVLEVVDKIVMVVPKNKDAFLSIAQSRSTAEYIFGHSLNVCILSVIIGSSLDYSSGDLRILGIGAILHDLGMLKIPKHIREKQYALSESDIKLIKTHPLHSYNLITKTNQFSKEVALVGLQHHENFNGKGYPKATPAEKIHDYAKIVSVADCFDAMTKKRAYRNEKVPFSIMKELLKSVGQKFDPKIMKAVLTHMAIYPVGSVVRLKDKTVGIVIKANTTAPLKPIVKVVYDEKLNKFEEPKVIDLLNDEIDNDIAGVINPNDVGISVVNEF